MSRAATALDVDAALYRARYRDLSGMTDAELMAHYEAFGEREGRIASPIALRDGLLRNIGLSADILEIGPFTQPVVRGSTVRYADVMDRAGLIARAGEIGGYPVEEVPDIDFVTPGGDLSVLPPENFDVVVSSHCIEHQPDLVAHLRQVERLLRPGGRYYLIVPDQRYCFDHFIAPSSVAEVIQAHHEGRRTHILASVIEHRALVTHNDAARHWAGDHGQVRAEVVPTTIAVAKAEFEAASGGYLDVHAWQFTPHSLREILEQLFAIGEIRLRAERVAGTPRGAQEFCAILQRPADHGVGMP
jgi:SAM-dependent methyltransferase